MTDSAVRTGLDRTHSGDAALERAARWALLTNRSARTSGDVWSGDALRAAGYRIALFLSPEHGLDATVRDGVAVPHGMAGGIPVMSLYGAGTDAVSEALEAVDGIIADLPDVGCRYYTYPWTVREVLRMAGVRGLPVVVLDRPNPLGGEAVEGSLPDPAIDSPVCASRVPVRHGLTPGELARWNAKDWNISVDLTVVPCAGWRRSLLWPHTGLPWIPPSPALRSFAAALVYPGICLLEGTTVSEGRGTETPFQVVGAPSLDAGRLAGTLSRSDLTRGARFEPMSFTPRSSKWEGAQCHGVRISVEDTRLFRPLASGLALVHALMETPGFAFRERSFDLLAGGSRWREALQAGASAEKITATWPEDELRFREERRSILLYES